MKFNHLLIYIILLFLGGCVKVDSEPESNLLHKVAFMPDIHFHDVFGEFRDISFKGLQTEFKGDTTFATIRTMESQLNSTRLFNENYFAFIAALDDAVTRGIKYIAIPGDFSDDGQPINIRGLKKILSHYESEFGVRFFLAPGNHDPNRPTDNPAGKHDFLGEHGREQPIFSRNHTLCRDKKPLNTPSKKNPHLVLCSDHVLEYGYENLLKELGSFGFLPEKQDQYFETPYSSYTYQEYNFERGLKAGLFQNRTYEICREGTGGEFKKESYTECAQVGDLSYLVEPVEGLWLLSVDANVYQPETTDEPFDRTKSTHFKGSGNAGFNRMITHKQQVIDWMGDVARRAEVLGKHLVTFSHFPMTEFYDGSYEVIADVFGTDGALQQKRMPLQKTSQVLLETGIKFHVGGHMHQNDTGVFRDERTGETLINIQAPSIAAYKPAYKALTLWEDDVAEIETILIEEVPNFRTLFPHYRQEWAYLDSTSYSKIWSKEVLEAKSYAEFTNWHIKELARLRFFPENWPKNLKNQLLERTAREMLALFIAYREGGSRFTIDEEQVIKNKKYLEAADDVINQNNMMPGAFHWTGSDLVLDFHRLLNAGELAFADITTERINQYRFMKTYSEDLPVDRIPGKNNIVIQLYRLFNILNRFISEEPSKHFRLHLKTGEIVDLEK